MHRHLVCLLNLLFPYNPDRTIRTGHFTLSAGYTNFRIRGNGRSLIQTNFLRPLQAIFTGFVQGQVLQELYSNCALYVLPSHVEGMALTLLEAMSAGARCLTSDIPENTDVLGEFGTSFVSGDEESLYQALSSLLSQPAENPRAEEQRQLIRQRYGYDTMVEKTLAVYEKARRQRHTRNTT